MVRESVDNEVMKFLQVSCGASVGRSWKVCCHLWIECKKNATRYVLRANSKQSSFLRKTRAPHGWADPRYHKTFHAHRRVLHHTGKCFTSPTAIVHLPIQGSAASTQCVSSKPCAGLTSGPSILLFSSYRLHRLYRGLQPAI